MIDTLLRPAALLAVAGLFGGMLLFAGGFAAFLFKALPPTDARALIRKAFPPFYLLVILCASLAALLAARIDGPGATALALIALTTVPARQVLMPAINDATDRDLRRRFAWLHGLSVILTLVHILIAGVVLVRLAG
jgi:hypothetical protein